MTLGRGAISLCWPLVLAAVVARAEVAGAQYASCAGSAAKPARVAWPAPLDRTLTLDARDLSLREALDRLASAARIRLSYASDFLPLDRRVCERFTGVAAGDAFVALLRGTALHPVVSGADLVVLAPRREGSAALLPERRRVDMLERIVVRSDATPDSRRTRSAGTEVIAAPALESSHGATRLDRLLDGAVPGMWLWEQSPSSVLARYGSIRGASSFGVSYPKIYLDGVEVANPLLLTDLGPASISHIEVIRGPQGAALYGTDAISGVVNVVTRHDGVAPDGRRVQLRSRMGLAASDYASRDVLAQEHSLSLRAGSSLRSAGLAASLGTIGDFLPNGYSRRVALNGDARVVGARSSLAVTARWFSQESGAADNPLLVGAPALPPTDSKPPQSARQYTIGATGTISDGGRWMHRATLGLDGYRLHDLDVQLGPFVSTADSVLHAAHGGADRATARVSSVARVGIDAHTAAIFTFAGEYSALREERVSDPALAPLPHQAPGDATRWRRNAGLTAQAQLALHDALFATAGLRVERSSGYVGEPQTSLLPMVGTAWIHDMGTASLKLRAAYGKGIRPVRASLRPGWAAVREFDAAALAPEQQTGIESGFDLSLGEALVLHVTRFDQRASGLVQSVVVPMVGSSGKARLSYQLQNVGEIANRGWELQATGGTGQLSLGATLSLVNSRVERVVSGYGGDLRAGDRMLEVPARTASLTGSWTASAWQASFGISRAADWMNYDRSRLAADATTGDAQSLMGDGLRDYWTRYDGVTRLRVSFSRALMRDLTGVIGGDNLLGGQRGEPDDVTVVPGRMVTAGVRVRF